LSAVDGGVVASVWKDGALVTRVILPSAGAKDPRIDGALAASGGELVTEAIVGEAPVLTTPEIALAMSFVAGKDGAKATLGDVTASVTPDDLLARQVYDHGVHIPALSLALGLDTKVLAALVAERLNTNTDHLFERATLKRIRVVRHSSHEPPH